MNLRGLFLAISACFFLGLIGILPVIFLPNMQRLVAPLAIAGVAALIVAYFMPKGGRVRNEELPWQTKLIVIVFVAALVGAAVLWRTLS
ncbi:MAG: peptidoglycan/LPS O-acetylase OafA/YrhL [Hyphomicrobiaceae bacterium]|jgi:peptidoglycan/LPS O-acetylase OafA/YrhL